MAKDDKGRDVPSQHREKDTRNYGGKHVNETGRGKHAPGGERDKGKK